MNRSWTQSAHRAMLIGTTVGLLGALPAHAAGSTADIQAANEALQAALSAVASSGIVDQLRQLHSQMANYQWRTTYALQQVPKKNMPGTRVALVPQPNWSQLDAENFFVSANIPSAGGPPPMNCPVAQLGGPAGRMITVTVPGTTRVVTLTDATIQSLLLRADPARGAQAWTTFVNLRNASCTALYNTAQLTFRFQKYQAVQANWAECTTNGFQISEWEHSQKFDFPGNHTRTAAIGGGLMFKCGAIYKGNADDALTYDSWFKWSDNSPEPLNFLQTLRAAGDSPNSCPNTCIPLIKGGGASASLCVGLDPGIAGINPNSSTVPLRLGAKLRAYSRDKTLCTPVLNVPAPFGLMQSLSEMADSAKQDGMKKMQDQLLAVLPVDKDTVSKVQTLMGLLQ